MLRLNNTQKNFHKGVSLVEIILAIALIGILLISFLNVFVFGFTTLVNAGKTTKMAYSAQAQMEVDRSTSLATGTDTMVFNFPTPGAITITGTVVEVEVNENGKIIKLYSFIPNK